MNTPNYSIDNFKNIGTSFSKPKLSASSSVLSNYGNISLGTSQKEHPQIESIINQVAQWFLGQSPMSNKKLQKLCYYAYCWFIVFFNDIESISKSNADEIRVLCPEHFQAWIHGPVLPELYYKYKRYGWQEIPQSIKIPHFKIEIENLLKQVWDAYGDFTADELEFISHQEMPWQKARNGILHGEACSKPISTYDILEYYSSLE